MSRIKIIKDSAAPANTDWQIVTGCLHRRQPDFFCDKVTKQEYSWLAMGLCWPVLAEQQDGCCVVIACSRDDDPVFTVVDAGYSATPRGLMEQCISMRDTWCGGSSALFGTITGPEELYQGMLQDFNETPKQRRLIIRDHEDADDKESDLLCIQAVRELAQSGRLSVSVDRIRDALRGMSLLDADKRLADSPCVAAVAWLVYDMVSRKSWLTDGDGDRPFLTE